MFFFPFHARFLVPTNISYKRLLERVKGQYPGQNFLLKYLDLQSDLVTIDSQYVLNEAFKEAKHAGSEIVKIFVNFSTDRMKEGAMCEPYTEEIREASTIETSITLDDIVGAVRGM